MGNEAMPSFQQQLEDLEGILDEFENCGHSEGRAIAECIKDGTSDLTDAERLEMSESMAAELVDYAKAIHERIRALKTTKKLRDTLPSGLVQQIDKHMKERGLAYVGEAHFLNWENDTVVGESCMKLAQDTLEFIKLLGDTRVIDLTGIWRAVAHQCTIYAYS